MDIILNSFSTLFFKIYPIVFISQNILWLISTIIQNPTLIDVGWGFNHFLVGSSLFYMTNNFEIKATNLGLIGIGLLSFWFLRLSGFLFYYRILKPYVDPRYEGMAEKRKLNKALYYFIQFQVQGILTMITSTPLYYVFMNNEKNIFNYFGIVLCLIGILGEALADHQLQIHKDKRQKNNAVFREGLFKNARHPNLFFELVFWFGIGFIGFNKSNIFTLMSFGGPTFLWMIMYYLTIPITTRHMLKTKEDYKKVMAETNMFWPF